jgi:MHS family proline/betaine transporter-like MFS transporter
LGVDRNSDLSHKIEGNNDLEVESEGSMRLFSSLNRDQKEAIGLLQIGTFLEFFDLMLYIHMAVVLNEIFFPQTDPHSASLLGALAFCSTYVLRPVGALIFGWIGDNIGRKSTIVITTFIMSISCLTMANLPTYAQIGISAAWIMTICRMAQGMTSMAEIIGAEIYVAESIRRPASYPAVAFIPIAASLGSLFALGVASLVTSFYMNWRLAFWVGAVIAFVGAIARTRLRETPEFLEMKRQQLKEGIASVSQGDDREEAEELLSIIKEAEPDQHLQKAMEFIQSAKDSAKVEASRWKQAVNKKTLMSFATIYCGWPLTFYLAFFYFNPTLKDSFGYSPADIIKHNFFLSLIVLLANLTWAMLSSKYHPIRILKTRWVFTFFFMLMLPLLIMNFESTTHIFLIQALVLLMPLNATPAEAVFMYHLPIRRRFTFATFLYALTQAMMYVITSFGLVILSDSFGPFGIWFITLPITLAYIYGVLYFEALERKTGNLALPTKNFTEEATVMA